MEPKPWWVGPAFALFFFVYVLILVSCASTSCDNPRNMSCMSAEELERELSRPLPRF